VISSGLKSVLLAPLHSAEVVAGMVILSVIVKISWDRNWSVSYLKTLSNAKRWIAAYCCNYYVSQNSLCPGSYRTW